MILLTSKEFLSGLSFSILVTIKPVVWFGKFLDLISSFESCLTDIFSFSIFCIFGVDFSSATLKSSEVSSLPSVIVLIISYLFLQIFTFTFFPTSVLATIIGSSFIWLITSPLNSKIISPALIPPFAKGCFQQHLQLKHLLVYLVFQYLQFLLLHPEF